MLEYLSLMSKLDYCFEPYKSPNVHAIKKRICDEHVRQHSTSKKSVFIIYLLEDEQELSLGMLIRLRRIYNFLLFHANIIQLSYTFWQLFILSLGLTYRSSAQPVLLFFCLFQYFEEKEYQTESKRNETFERVIFETNTNQETWTRRQGSFEEATRVQGTPPTLVGPSWLP